MEIDIKILRSLVKRGNNGSKNAFTKLLVMAKNEELRREISKINDLKFGFNPNKVHRYIHRFAPVNLKRGSLGE